MPGRGVLRCHYRSAAGCCGRIESLVLWNTLTRIPDAVRRTYALGQASASDAMLAQGVGAWWRQTLGHRLDLDRGSEGLWLADGARIGQDGCSGCSCDVRLAARAPTPSGCRAASPHPSSCLAAIRARSPRPSRRRWSRRYQTGASSLHRLWSRRQSAVPEQQCARRLGSLAIAALRASPR